MGGDVVHDLREGGGELGSGGLAALPTADQIQHSEEVPRGAEGQQLVLGARAVQGLTVVNDPLPLLLRQHHQGLLAELLPKLLRGGGEAVQPDAEMLVDALGAVDALMHLVGAGHDDVPMGDGVEGVLHQKGDLSRQVDVDLIEVVDVLPVVGGRLG